MALALTASVAGIGLPAQAHLQTRSDGDDSRGPLDIGRVAMRHGRYVFVSATIRQPWSSLLLASGDPTTAWDDSHIEWQLDTQRDNADGSYADYIVVFDHRRGRLVGRLLRWTRPYDGDSKRRPVDAKVSVWRNGRTAIAKVRRSALRPDKKDWGWMGATLYKGQPPCDDGYGCYDTAWTKRGFLFTHNT